MAYEVTKAPVPPPTADSASHALNIMGYVHAIRRHKSLMFLGVIIGMGLGGLYYSQVRPVYETSAKVLITLKNPDVLGSGDRGFSMEDQVANQISMIRSPLVAKEAAKAPPSKPKTPEEVLKELAAKEAAKGPPSKPKTPEELAKELTTKEAAKAPPSIAKNKEEAVKDFDPNYVATAQASKANDEVVKPNPKLIKFFGNVDPDALSWAILGGLNATRGDARSGESLSVVTLTYRTGDPDAAKAVLEEVIEAHKRVVTKSYGDLDQQTVEFIKSANGKLSEQLKETFEKYRDAKLASIKTGDRSFLSGGEKSSLNEKTAFQSKQEALLTRNGEIRTHLNAIHRGWVNYKPTKTLLAMADRFMNTSGPVIAVSPMSDSLINMMAQEQELASVFGKDFVPLQRLQAKIAIVKKLTGRNIEQTEDDKETPLARHIRALKEEEDCNNTLCAAYGSLLGEQMEKLKKACRVGAGYAYRKAFRRLLAHQSDVRHNAQEAARNRPHQEYGWDQHDRFVPGHCRTKSGSDSHDLPLPFFVLGCPHRSGSGLFGRSDRSQLQGTGRCRASPGRPRHRAHACHRL